jgi:hypothetical protein
LLEGVARRGASRVHAELAIDRAEVCIDGAEADDELLRDLRIGATGRPVSS